MSETRATAPITVEEATRGSTAVPRRRIVDRLGSIDPDRIVTSAPEEPFRLTFIDVTCLLLNRTIGTGIFNGPQVVMKGVKSPAIAMLLWFCGCIYCLCGAHVFLEYGLNVPRYIIDGIEQSVPRSGGELHYLQYVFSRPRYRKGTVILIGVVFGISFICVGNMASNCIDCALHLCRLGNDTSPSESKVRGVAIAIATVTCFIHAFSRRGGIFLNNVFAVVKILFLLSMVIATWAVIGSSEDLRRLAGNTRPVSNASATSEEDSTSAAQAFLFVVFAFFGFDQPSYVLGEVRDPRRTFPRALWWGVGLVSVLYLAVNVCYMLVVPAEVQVQRNVAEEFFARIFDPYEDRAQKIVNAFLAVSSFGNVVMWTFPAARMKQEIAKQCFLPFASFFATDKDVSFGRLLSWLQESRLVPFRRLGRTFNPSSHKEKTPVGAFVLHLLTCIVLIVATYRMSAEDAYYTLTSLFSYVLAACFGTFLALGILLLHLRGPSKTKAVSPPNRRGHLEQDPTVQQSWREITKDVINPTLSIVCAIAYLLGSLYPVIAIWIPPPNQESASVRWYVVPLAAICILIFATVYFFGFLAINVYRGKAGNKEFIYTCVPEFGYADSSAADPRYYESRAERYGDALRRRGGLVLTREIIHKTWTARELDGLYEDNNNHTNNHDNTIQMRTHRMQHGDRRSQRPTNDLSNTDFAGFTQAPPFADHSEQDIAPESYIVNTAYRGGRERVYPDTLYEHTPVSSSTR